MTSTSVPLPGSSPMPRRALFWLVGIALWTLFPLLIAAQNGLYATYMGESVNWTRLLSLRLADWYTCAVFTPFCFWLVRRFPLQRHSWRRNLAVQLLATSAAVVVKYAMYVELAKRLRPTEVWRLDAILVRSFASESIAFWILLAIVHGIEVHRRWREREVQAARLEAELASARLDALTAQLQPHFLFNTLNSVSTLMRRDVNAAEEMLSHLGALLHRTLRPRDGHEVTLAEELDVLEQYLAIMKIRFHDRLLVRTEVEEGLSAARVPHLVLQPLVENAIRHGISRKPGAGVIEIAARRAGDVLEISVRDDGEGVGSAKDGIGLSNTRRRLRQLYGDAQSLELVPAAEGGSRVTLRIPLALHIPRATAR